MRELTELLKEANQTAGQRNAKLSFALVYPDKGGRMIFREIGSCYSNSKRVDRDDRKTLDDVRFEIGDYLDVAIYN